MKIKKLEILGFKSFIDKSILTFPKGITAVVGPNGSGKSNLVDAIKWALGEQSAKTLRGKAMEDIIFNGSGDKKPLGMAEVTLTFTNADGGVPYKYSNYHEITVRRRIYRSGESEYFLNKAPCRLKDISGLFMGTGVGSKTYSIIAQGQIGSIISARPTDRRVFIEEAAGITKYKSKKVEAIRKIESTRNNLLRIGDIIGEVKRQMDSLAQQARKAEEYKELKDDLKRLELIDASRKFMRLKDQIDAEEEKLKGQGEEEAVAQAALSVVEGKIEELKTTSLEKEEALSEVQRLYYSNETDIRTVEESIKHMRDRIESTLRRNEALEAEKGELADFIGETRERIEEINRRIESSQGEADSLGRDLAEIEERLSGVAALVEELAERGEELQKVRLTRASRMSELKNGIDSAGRLIEKFTGLIAERERELKSLDGEIEKITGALEEGTSELERAEADEKSCTERLSEAEGRMEALTREEADILKEREETRSAGSRVETKLEALLEMERNYEGLNEGVKGVMTGSREGVIGIFSDLIETDEGDERALEGYLGEAVSAVVVNSMEDAKSHIDRLKSDRSGRAVFIPLNDLNGNIGDSALSDDGVLGRLKDRVKIRGGTSANGDILSFFGDAHLVDTLDSALKIWEKRHPAFPIVTLDGEVVTPEGLVFGGSREGGFSLLKNRREKETLEGEAARLADAVKDVEGCLEKTREELLSAKADFKSEEKALTNHTIRSQTLKKELEATTKDKERMERQKLELEAAIKRETEEIERLKQEKDSSLKELATAESEEAEIRAEDEALKTDLSEKRRTMKDIEEEETEARLSLNKSRDQKEHLAESVRELEKQIERAERDMENKAKAISEGEAEIEGFRGKITEGESGLSEKIAASEGYQDRIRDARAEVDGSLSKERELEEDRKSCLRNLTEIKEGMQQKRDGVKELNWELEKLTAGVEERYREKIEETYLAYISEVAEDEELGDRLDKLKKRIERFGEVNLLAISEYNSRKERYEFLQTQETDLLDSLDSLNKTIQKIDRKSKERFLNTFDEINEKFGEVFPRLVPGGKANIVLTDKEDPLESGVDILAQPPGKKLSSISLLSGGEKALTAISLIFAIFMIKPTPFCMMDEVDAPLDDLNIERFVELLKEISLSSQVILITHNKKTMEMADTLYGITMEDPGVSKMVSVRLKDEGEVSAVS